MNAAPFRITLGKDGKSPRFLSRIIESDTLDGAVLCAQQWTVWGNASYRRRHAQYSWYRVEARNAQSAWDTVSQGTLADARVGWTPEDEARLEASPDVLELFPYTDEPQRRTTRPRRTPGAPKSRLAQLVAKVLADKR